MIITALQYKPKGPASRRAFFKSQLPQQPVVHAGFLTSRCGSLTNTFGSRPGVERRISRQHSVQIEDVSGDGIDIVIAKRFRRMLRHGAADLAADLVVWPIAAILRSQRRAYRLS